MNYTVEAKIITPVHVGAGQEKKLVKDIDFFYVKGEKKIIIVDLPKIFQTLSENERAAFLSLLSSGQTDKFGNYLLNTRKIKPEDFQIAKIDCPYEPEKEILPLTTIPAGDKRIPYIPGSSLKGAIRSVIITHLYEQHNRNNNNNRKNAPPDEKILLGPIENNLMSLLQVGDFSFEKSRIDKIKTFNLINDKGEYRAGWKHDRKASEPQFASKGFVICCETFPTNSIARGFIRIKNERFDYLSRNRRTPEHFTSFNNINTLQAIFGLINQHTRRYLLAEKNFFEHYDDDESDTGLIIQSIDDLLDYIPEQSNECLLHMGFGSGFHGITGNWKFPDNHYLAPSQGKPPAYKSRKIVFRNLKDKGFHFMPMGFIKLSIK